MSEYGSRYKRRRSEFVFGVILVTIMLPLLVLIERSLGLETRWLAGANCMIIILIFIVVMRRWSYNRKEDK
jgi:ABC-type glycerol-3-phosphate transport system permease component